MGGFRRLAGTLRRLEQRVLFSKNAKARTAPSEAGAAPRRSVEGPGNDYLIVPFPFAARVFLDENRLEWADTREQYGELRWIGKTPSGSSPQERQSDRSVKTTGIVKFTLDPKRPPALTQKG